MQEPKAERDTDSVSERLDRIEALIKSHRAETKAIDARTLRFEVLLTQLRNSTERTSKTTGRLDRQMRSTVDKLVSVFVDHLRRGRR